MASDALMIGFNAQLKNQFGLGHFVVSFLDFPMIGCVISSWVHTALAKLKE